MAITELLGETTARRFHDVYESLAPSFGYVTREETKDFDPESPDGQLMCAVCEIIEAEIINEWKLRAELLWGILDDIDTSSDAIKPNNLIGYTRFHDSSMSRVEKRFDVLTSDGYELSVPKKVE